MKMTETLAAATIAAGLLTSCASSQPVEKDPCLAPNTEVTADAIKFQAQCAYDDAKDFWTPQGVNTVPTLYFPRNDETVTCGREVVTPAKGRQVAAAACYATTTLFVWPEGLVGQVKRAVDRGAVLREVVGEIVHHDYAHLSTAQLARGEIIPGYVEPMADCMGAVALRVTNPDARPSVRILYEGIEEHLGRPDPRHGTAAQRMASFDLGFNSQSLQACENVVPLTPVPSPVPTR